MPSFASYDFGNPNSTTFPSGKNIQRKWFLVDAEGIPVGRVASEIAKILQGKNNPLYTPFIDLGDHVIVINAEKAIFTGKKLESKTYFRHTGYPGGGRKIFASDLQKRRPVGLIEEAIKGMMPKTRLGDKMGKKLKVYAGTKHPHAAQQPSEIFLTCEKLQDPVIFRRRLVREHGAWLKKLSPAQRTKEVLVWGGEAYSPQRIQSELVAESDFAKSYTKMMYDSHFHPI